MACETLSTLALLAQACERCPLHQARIQAVPGQGHPQASVVIIGEAPGKNEDIQGQPFCGASGKLLDQLLDSINLNRSKVYITNLVKCRPPANRDPLPLEVSLCTSQFLDPELALIQPKLIITLGRHALSHFIPNLQISKVHGQLFKHQNRPLLALYHPAVALYNGSHRKTLEQDFLLIPKLLESI